MSKEFFVELRVTGLVRIVIEADDADEAEELASGMSYEELIDSMEDIETEVTKIDDEDLTEGDDSEDDISEYIESGEDDDA